MRVIILEQTDLSKTLVIIKELLNKDKAQFKFIPRGSYVYIDDEAVNELLKQHLITRKVFEQNVRKIVKSISETISLEQEGTSAETQEILQNLPVEKWKREYKFVASSIISTIDRIRFQPIIKSIDNDQFMVNGIINLRLVSNSGPEKEIDIEVNNEIIGDLIIKLKDCQEKLESLEKRFT